MLCSLYRYKDTSGPQLYLLPHHQNTQTNSANSKASSTLPSVILINAKLYFNEVFTYTSWIIMYHIYFSFFLFVCFFRHDLSMQTLLSWNSNYVNQTDLELSDLPVSDSWVLGFKKCAISTFLPNYLFPQLVKVKSFTCLNTITFRFRKYVHISKFCQITFSFFLLFWKSL